MNKYWLLFILIYYPLTSALCQGCFSDGYVRLAHLENSGVAFPVRNTMIQESLLGCKVPDFTVKTIKGESISLAELNGKVVVINFWFTSCAPCIAEMPALNKLVEEFKDSDVVFIAFARDDANELARFLEKRPFNFNIVASANDMAKSYCVELFGWPTSMVVDKSGIVRKITSGAFTDERAETQIFDVLYPVIKKYLD
jgi:peroxiredoxin